MKQYFQANKKLWDNKVDFHVKSPMYDMESFKKGKSSLCPISQKMLGDISGKSILHLQCHFGQDSMSMARMGANVTAVDFSPKAIEKARAINNELNLNVNFVEANVLELQDHLDGKFDIVFTSFGTIVWLPDLDLWASVIKHFLKEDGQFIFVEFHPAIDTVDWDSGKISYNYFNRGTPYKEISQGTYADKDAPLADEEYFWIHSLDEIFNALMSKGLKLQSFKEYPFSSYDVFGEMEKLEEWKYVCKQIPVAFPHMFSVVFS